jgi:hypothetical protein
MDDGRRALIRHRYGKRQRMREGRVWQVDPPSYFTEGRYLAVAPEAATLPIDYLPGNITTAQAAERFNAEEAHLRRVLRDALGLAIALNRMRRAATLVRTGLARLAPVARRS